MEERVLVRCPDCYSSDTFHTSEYWYCYNCANSFSYPPNPNDYDRAVYERVCKEVDSQLYLIRKHLEDLDDWDARDIEKLFDFLIHMDDDI